MLLLLDCLFANWSLVINFYRTGRRISVCRSLPKIVHTTKYVNSIHISVVFSQSESFYILKHCYLFYSVQTGFEHISYFLLYPIFKKIKTGVILHGFCVAKIELRRHFCFPAIDQWIGKMVVHSVTAVPLFTNDQLDTF